MTISQALGLALQHHQAGRLSEAEALYRQILAVQPSYADALHLLGVLADQVGRHDIAVGLIRKAIAVNPAELPYHLNLGNALLASGQIDEAIATYRRAVEIQPHFSEAHSNMGNALTERGRFDEAIAACRRALQINPNFPEARNNLGNALRGHSRLDEAIAEYRSALQLKPHFAEAHNNLGNVLRECGQIDEAIHACRVALQIRPVYPEAHNSLGDALRERGSLDEAIGAYRRALEIKSDFPDAHNNLGNALRDGGRTEEAIAAYRRALELKPGDPEIQANLANALTERGLLDEAIATYNHSLRLQPHSALAHNGLGNALKDRGELDAAIAAFRRAIQLQPEKAANHSNLIYTLRFHPDYDDGKIAEEHQSWNRRFSEPFTQSILPHANDRGPKRRLKIGYVSPDFYDQAESYFVVPLFEAHDHSAFEIHAYASVRSPDAITTRLKKSVDVWDDVRGVPNHVLSDRIRKDGIDVLVDLTMHMRDNRLPLFCRRPTPVQVSWLAYPGSTGVPGIGYRLTDSHMEPSGQDAAWSSEEPVRLPEVQALPALSAGHITFGSLNNFCKVHEGVLDRWARLLAAVEGSRLLLRCPEGCARDRIRAYFAARGIEEQRVELLGAMPRSEYLRLYHRIDLALDPYPYNGITTTCDALWMGVPVLTLPGITPASRSGLSLLSSAGMLEFVASSEADYLEMARNLAVNLPALAEKRANLRPRMLASRLMDAPRFARHVETAYSAMWERWCVTGG